MLTKKDLSLIESIIEEKLEEKLNEKLKFLPTKDEFYEKMDEVMGKLKAIREEHEVLGGKSSEHSDQLEDHEKRILKLEKSPVLQPTI